MMIIEISNMDCADIHCDNQSLSVILSHYESPPIIASIKIKRTAALYVVQLQAWI